LPQQVIAGVELRVPDRDTVLLHVVLNTAHNAKMLDGKPMEDLRRALALVEVAEELYALLCAEYVDQAEAGDRCKRHLPRPDYMRWWSPLARSGKLGLAGAYLWRTIWIIGQAPTAITRCGASSEGRARVEARRRQRR
jgi:hypothetical protein